MVIQILDIRVRIEHLLLYVAYLIFEQVDVRVNEFNAHVILCNLLGFLYLSIPCFHLCICCLLCRIIEDLFLFIAQSVKELQVCDQNVRNDLVHCIGIILGNLTVFVLCQSQLIVLRSVDNSLLDCCVYFTETHRRSGCTECICHLYAGRTLLNTHLQTFQVIRCVDRLLRIEVS